MFGSEVKEEVGDEVDKRGFVIEVEKLPTKFFRVLCFSSYRSTPFPSSLTSSFAFYPTSPLSTNPRPLDLTRLTSLLDFQSTSRHSFGLIRRSTFNFPFDTAICSSSAGNGMEEELQR